MCNINHSQTWCFEQRQKFVSLLLVSLESFSVPWYVGIQSTTLANPVTFAWNLVQNNLQNGSKLFKEENFLCHTAAPRQQREEAEGRDGSDGAVGRSQHQEEGHRASKRPDFDEPSTRHSMSR